MSTDLAVWVAAIATLVSFTIVWKPTKPFNLLQSMYVGLASGYGVTLGVQNIRSVALTPFLEGNFVYGLPLLLGVMLLLRYHGSTRWLSAFPQALLVGVGTGLSIRGVVRAEILNQIRATMIPFNSLDNIVIILATLGTTAYFVFTFAVDRRTSLGATTHWVREWGRYSLLVMFGAAFAMSVQGRLSLLIARFQFIFQTWLGLGV